MTRRLLAIMIIFLFISVPQESFGNVESEFYNLDYRLRQWMELQQKNPSIVLPPGFEQDVKRHRQLAVMLSVEKSQSAAEIVAKESAKSAALGMLKSAFDAEKTLSLIESRVKAYQEESKFWESVEKRWLEDSKVDVGVAVTAYDAANPEHKEALLLQEMKDEAVRRQRDLEKNIAEMQQKREQLEIGLNTLKTALNLSKIRDAVGKDDFFSAAKTAIETGSTWAKTIYDEDTFKAVSGRLGSAKTGLDAIKHISQGNYLDASISTVNLVDGLIKDVSKDLAKEAGTIKLFMDSDFFDESLRNNAESVIDIASRRKEDLEKIQEFKTQIKLTKDTLGNAKKAVEWATYIYNGAQRYQQIANEPGRSAVTANLIAGMSALGELFIKGSNYLPPGLRQTVGEYLKFYGEALKLGDSIDKKIRNIFVERGDCLNKQGGMQFLSWMHVWEYIEKKYPRYPHELCINRSKELRNLGMYEDVIRHDTQKPNEPRYFFIPSEKKNPISLTDNQYSDVLKIISDFGAYTTIIEKKYKITNNDLRQIIIAVNNEKNTFTINDGWFRDTSYEIDKLSEDVRVLLHVREAIGEMLTPKNARTMITEWIDFERYINRMETLCDFKIFAHAQELNRQFISWLEQRDIFYSFVNRRTLLDSKSRCRVSVKIDGEDSVTVSEAVVYQAALEGTLPKGTDVTYEWRFSPEHTLKTGESASIQFDAPGRHEVKLVVRARFGGFGSPVEIASRSLKVEAREPEPEDAAGDQKDEKGAEEMPDDASADMPSGDGQKKESTGDPDRPAPADAQPEDYRRPWGEKDDPDQPTGPPTDPQTTDRQPIQDPGQPPAVDPETVPEQDSGPGSGSDPDTVATPIDSPRGPGETEPADPPVVPGPPSDDVSDTQPPGQDPEPDPAAPPACTFEYSEWGPCDRDSKKQTRTVVGTSPEGCVESGQPVLEQGCTPPPTAEERRLSLLNCLCYGPPMGGAGGYRYYDPNNCNNNTRGPCSQVPNFGGCNNTFIQVTEEQKKNCYVRHMGDGDQDSWDKEFVDALIKEENDKAKLPLEVELRNIDECPVTVQLGEIVTFTAMAKGGIPPHTYSWTGNGQAENNTFTFANSRQPGTHPVSVTVSDNDGSSATMECPIIVDVVTVTIEKTSPAENELPVGAKASFRATVTSADKPVSGELLYRWEPHPEVQFGDEANPQHETTSASTTATYLRPGDVGMWVNVLQREGETYRTIGESDQLPISIIGPTLTLTVDKDQPRVGDAVVVTVKEEPAIKDDDIAFVWEVQGDVLSSGAAPNVPNHRAHSFVFKDSQAVTVTVAARTKVHGDDLGTESIVLEAQAQGYEVSISGPEYRGPKPRIWKCDGQLGTAADCRMVEVDQEWAVFRDLGLTAIVEPDPEKGPVRYRWSIDPGGICGIPGTGKELTINCSQTGTYQVQLEARDSQDVVLGRAEKSVAITISQEDLDNAEQLMVTLSADTESVRVGETATIQAEVSGGNAPLTFTWSANVDGADQAATFTPTEPGAQTIAVQVADADGMQGEAEIELDVEPEPLEAALTGEPMSIRVGETTTLTATVTGGMPDYSYAWTGVDGSGESAQWIPDEPEDREISVQVTDSRGETSVASLVVAVQPLPLKVELSADSVEVNLDDAVAFQAEVSGGKPEYAYEWTGVDGQGAGAAWKAESSGVHVFGVQVTDADGQTASAEVEVNVKAPPLKVDISVDKKEVRVGEPVQFTAQVSGGEPDFTFAWGGGPHGQGNVASWSPDEPGDYDVTVNVTDKGGQTESATVSIKVQPPKLEVALVADKTEVSQWDWVTLTAEVTGGLPEYSATWSEDISGKGLEGTFFARKSGKQTLSVTVRDKSRQSASARITLDVQYKDPVIVDEPGPLNVILVANQDRIVVGQTATLRAETSGGAGPYTYSWSQAVKDNGESALFTPTETGFYQLFVEVRDAKQARQTARIDIHVEQGTMDAQTSATSVVGGPLDVQIIPERTSVAQGESMTLQAQTSGGREPYAYSWSQSVHGTGDTVVFAPSEPGYYQLFVEVRDADHHRVTAQVNVQVQQAQVHVQSAPRQQPPAPANEQSPLQPGSPAQMPTQSSTAAQPYSIAGDTRARGVPSGIDYEKVRSMISELNQGLGTRAQEIEAATSTNTTAAPIPESYGKVGFGSKPKDKDEEKEKKRGKPDHGSQHHAGPQGSTPGTSPGGLKDVIVNSRNITLSIWDHGKEDNDIVTIKVNGAPIPGGSNVVLTKQPKTFQLQLNTGRNEISIYAVNEGTQPPNTASFKLSNVTQGEQEQRYRINQGENAAFGATVVIQ